MEHWLCCRPHLYMEEYEPDHKKPHVCYETKRNSPDIQRQNSIFLKRVPVIQTAKRPNDSRTTHDNATLPVKNIGLPKDRSVSPIFPLYQPTSQAFGNQLVLSDRFKKEKVSIIFDENQEKEKKRSQYSTDVITELRAWSPPNHYPEVNIYERQLIQSILSAQRNNMETLHYPETLRSALYQRGKRARTIFTPSQLKKLEEKFEECSFIVGEDRQNLARELKLTEQQVKIWFQNRRTKCKQGQTRDKLPEK